MDESHTITPTFLSNQLAFWNIPQSSAPGSETSKLQKPLNALSLSLNYSVAWV